MLVDVWIFHTNGSRTSSFLLPAWAIRYRRCSSLRPGFRLDQQRQRFLKRLSGLREHNAILGTLRPCETGLDRIQIEREQFGILRFRRLLVMKQPLLARVSLDQGD